MRKLLYLILCFVFLQTFLVSCEDHFETGIEGQWQLQKVVDKDGVTHIVDTVFYSFKKKVFRQLILVSDKDGDTFICYGNYTKEGDKLSIKVEESTFIPREYSDKFDWDTYSREFIIKKQKNNTLELNLEGALYVLRKY